MNNFLFVAGYLLSWIASSAIGTFIAGGLCFLAATFVTSHPVVLGMAFLGGCIAKEFILHKATHG